MRARSSVIARAAAATLAVSTPAMRVAAQPSMEPARVGGAVVPRNDPDQLMLDAILLRRQNRRAAALQIMDRACALAPHRADLRRFRDILRQEVDGGDAMLLGNYREWDNRLPTWREAQVSLRHNSPIGAVVPRYSYLERGGRSDEKVEIEAYPSFPGGYLALGVGASPTPTLYPASAYSGELFVSLPAQLELSGGYRRMNFSAPVEIVTGSLGAYFGNYLLGSRVNHVLGDGTTVGILGRRYLTDDGSYVGVVGSTGTVPFAVLTRSDFDVHSSRSAGLEGLVVIRSHWFVMARGEIGRDELPGGGAATVTAGHLGFGVRLW